MLKVVPRMPQFVLPACLSNRHGHELERLTLQRDIFQLKYPDVRILLICPRRDTAIIRDHLGTELYSYLEDEDILTHPHHKSWFNQQIIKILAARQVVTPFYVTLDSDILPLRSMTPDDFVVDGRGLYKYTNMNMYKWHADTASFLGMPMLPNQWPCTPLVYSKQAWSVITDRIGEGWEKLLSESTLWMENTLYYYGLHYCDILDKYHKLSERDNAFYLDDVQGLNGGFFESPKRPLLCMSSATRIHPQCIRDKLIQEGVLGD